jgi:hypothetical protein
MPNWVIYSLSTGRVRRIYSAAVGPTAPKTVAGEGVLPLFAGIDLPAAQARVTSATGKTPSGDRYCIIDAGNNILGAIIGDPALDSVANCTLVAHDSADTRWFYNGTTFTAPFSWGIAKTDLPIAVGGSAAATAQNVFGIVGASSSDTNIATVTISIQTVTVHGIAAGTATISVHDNR